MIRGLILIMMLIIAISGCGDEDAEPSPAEGAAVESTPTMPVATTPTPTTEEVVTKATATSPATMLPTPTSEPSPTAIATATPDWDVETCPETADLFIGRVQALLDGVSEMEISAFTSPELPVPLQAFEADVDRISAISDELGCTEEEIAVLIEERIDQLEAEGPVAQILLQGLREGVESGELFPATGD